MALRARDAHRNPPCPRFCAIAHARASLSPSSKKIISERVGPEIHDVRDGRPRLTGIHNFTRAYCSQLFILLYTHPACSSRLRLAVFRSACGFRLLLSTLILSSPPLPLLIQRVLVLTPSPLRSFSGWMSHDTSERQCRGLIWHGSRRDSVYIIYVVYINQLFDFDRR